MTETLPTQSDERENLPSASGLDRLSHCPGSRAAEAGLSELPKDAATEEGTNIHDALYSGDDSELELTEKQIAEKLRQMEQRALEAWVVEFSTTLCRMIRETRYWIRDATTLDLIASAKPDVVYICDDAFALVLDYKTGFAGATASERNMQLRCQAIAVFQEHKVRHIRAAIAHSRLSSKFDSVDFTLDDLRRVERELRHIIWRSEQPDAPRVPGPHCRYCRALGTCPEASTYAMVMSSRAPAMRNGKPDQLAIIETVGRMKPDELAFVHQRRALANAVFEAVEARMKQLPAAALQAVGFRLADGNKIREILDAATAFARLAPLLKHEAGDDRLIGLKLVIGKMAEALADRTSVSLESAKNQIYAALGDTVLEKEGSKRLRPL